MYMYNLDVAVLVYIYNFMITTWDIDGNPFPVTEETRVESPVKWPKP